MTRKGGEEKSKSRFFATHRRSKSGFFVFSHARVRPLADPLRDDTLEAQSARRQDRKHCSGGATSRSSASVYAARLEDSSCMATTKRDLRGRPRRPCSSCQ